MVAIFGQFITGFRIVDALFVVVDLLLQVKDVALVARERGLEIDVGPNCEIQVVSLRVDFA